MIHPVEIVPRRSFDMIHPVEFVHRGSFDMIHPRARCSPG
jgi:hypothetical protein